MALYKAPGKVEYNISTNLVKNSITIPFPRNQVKHLYISQPITKSVLIDITPALGMPIEYYYTYATAGLCLALSSKSAGYFNISSETENSFTISVYNSTNEFNVIYEV